MVWVVLWLIYLNEQGFHIFLSSRGDTVESVASKIGCHSQRADFNNYNECEKVVGVATEAMGSVDAVVNVAGGHNMNLPSGIK